MKQDHIDAWVLVADSKGVNVFCAAGGDEFNTHSVVSVVKTSGIADLVNHKRLILPALGAPGIRAADVREQTGWKVRWGPVRYHDIPVYLAQDGTRDEFMKRATYDWRERLHTALGSMFVFYFLIGIGFLVFARSLFMNYLLVGALCFFVFYLICPWIPGKNGGAKALILEIILLGLLGACELWSSFHGCPFRSELIIAMVMLLLFGMELGELASTMPSDLDPFLAKLGIVAIGNMALAGTIRTELLNGYRLLILHGEKCIGCRSCHEVCLP